MSYGKPNGYRPASIPFYSKFEREQAVNLDRLPPHSIPAEQGVIGSIILDPEVFDDVLAIIDTTDLYRAEHQIIYGVLKELKDNGIPIDGVTLGAELENQYALDKAGGDLYLGECVERVEQDKRASPQNATDYARIVAERARRRRLMETGEEMIRQAWSGPLTEDEIANAAAKQLAVLVHTPTGDDSQIQMPSPWPKPLSEAAYWGPMGAIVKEIEPHTTADPAAILIQLIVAFSNLIGHGPHWCFEMTRHALNLFCCLVGPSSRGGKGTSWDYIRRIMGEIEPSWIARSKMSGLATGEGLIYKVRDPMYQKVKIGEGYENREIDPGVDDKRALWIETEFAGTLTLAGKDGNILSTRLRQLWETGDAESATRGSPMKCTGAHVSIIAHTTLKDLFANLSSVDISNGFANRFLWVCARKSKVLSRGGNFRLGMVALPIAELQEAYRLTAVTNWEETVMTMSKPAWELWDDNYAHLSRDRAGDLDDLCARAEPIVRRLACIYAIADGTFQVQVGHLEAGLEIWRYCEDSAACVFGDRAHSNPDEEKLLDALRTAADNRLSQTQIQRTVFRGHKSSEQVAEVVGRLVRAGRVRQFVTEKPAANGKVPLLWELAQKSS